MATIYEYGFNKFLNRSVIKTEEETQLPQELSDDDFDFSVENISANKINSGQMISSNNQMTIDLDKGEIIFKDGAILKSEIKKFLDNKFGVRVYDSQGNTVEDITG